MWLERFGGVDQNIFFGFCAVVFVVVVVSVVVFITRLCSTSPAIPGHSLTFFTLMSSLMICVSVLFRGVQPAWTTSSQTLQSLCQVFIPMLVLGYTLFAAALFIRLWMLLLALRWEKNTVEWLGHFVLWVILMIAAVLVIIWEYSFPPNTHPATAGDFTEEANASTTDNAVSPVGVYECRGWLEDGSSDMEQLAWRLTMTCYLAVLLLLAVVALPFYSGLPKHTHWVRLNVVLFLLVTINSLCCVVVGLIVWYQYNPTPLSASDNNKYAVIGALQLWMVLVAVASNLFTELVALRRRPSANVGGITKQSFSSNYSANASKRESRESTSNVDVVAERDVTDDRDDVTGGDRRSTNVGAVIEYDEVRWEQRNSHPPDGDNAEEMHEYLEVDSGHGTSVDHGADTARSSYRTSVVDEDVPAFY